MRGLSAGAADTVIVNTCAVTAEAERQARQAIRRLARERPEARIVVTGCAAQIDPAAWAALPDVRRVLGNGDKLGRKAGCPGPAGACPTSWRRARPRRTGDRVRRPGARLRAGAAGLRPSLHLLHHPVRPRPEPLGADRRHRRRRCARWWRAAIREIVLTGVDIAAYGPDLPGAPTLGQMVRRLLARCRSCRGCGCPRSTRPRSTTICGG